MSNPEKKLKATPPSDEPISPAQLLIEGQQFTRKLAQFWASQPEDGRSKVYGAPHAIAMMIVAYIEPDRVEEITDLFCGQIKDAVPGCIRTFDEALQLVKSKKMDEQANAEVPPTKN
ncbi:MAG: hypothetical protein ACWGQW_00195 [bacterium]